MSYYGPSTYICEECEEDQPVEGAEWDVADYPDGDEDGRQRGVMICAECLAAPTMYQERSSGLNYKYLDVGWVNGQGYYVLEHPETGEEVKIGIRELRVQFFKLTRLEMP